MKNYKKTLPILVSIVLSLTSCTSTKDNMNVNNTSPQLNVKKYLYETKNISLPKSADLVASELESFLQNENVDYNIIGEQLEDMLRLPSTPYPGYEDGLRSYYAKDALTLIPAGTETFELDENYKIVNKQVTDKDELHTVNMNATFNIFTLENGSKVLYENVSNDLVIAGEFINLKSDSDDIYYIKEIKNNDGYTIVVEGLKNNQIKETTYDDVILNLNSIETYDPFILAHYYVNKNYVYTKNKNYSKDDIKQLLALVSEFKTIQVRRNYADYSLQSYKSKFAWEALMEVYMLNGIENNEIINKSLDFYKSLSIEKDSDFISELVNSNRELNKFFYPLISPLYYYNDTEETDIYKHEIYINMKEKSNLYKYNHSSTKNK